MPGNKPLTREEFRAYMKERDRKHKAYDTAERTVKVMYKSLCPANTTQPTARKSSITARIARSDIGTIAVRIRSKTAEYYPPFKASMEISNGSKPTTQTARFTMSGNVTKVGTSKILMEDGFQKINKKYCVMAKTCVTQNKVTITFSTPEEIATLNLIKGITFSRSYKKAIMQMVETYDALSKECSNLKAASHK